LSGFWASKSHVAAAPICLRPRSRSASVIDRLLKNQNPLKIVIIFDHPRRTLVLDRRPGNRAAILRSEIHRHGSHGCSDRRCSVRAFDDSTARRSAAAASRGPSLDASRAGWRPHHVILECKIAARLIWQRVASLVLTYATTIHKSQGSEYPAVVIPLSIQHYPMLQRNLCPCAPMRRYGPRGRKGQRRMTDAAHNQHSETRRPRLIHRGPLRRPTSGVRRL
jgi:hypothetical protein